MKRHGRLAALLVLLPLLGCAQAATGSGQASHAPYSYEGHGNAPDGGGGEGGGAGM